MKAGEPLYVSAGKTGGVVSRFGLERTYIGAKRSPDDPRRLVFDHDEVVLIPATEAKLYLREYSKAITEGALVERSAKDFEAWNAKVESEAKAKAEAEAKATAEHNAEVKAAADKVAKQQAAEQPALAEAKAPNISLEEGMKTSNPGNVGNRK